MAHIAIIGGGLSGRLVAWYLLEAGHRISLFDLASRTGEQSAAYIAAAMLAPIAEAIEATPNVVALGEESLPLWQTLLPKLPLPVFFQQAGSLIVWHSQDKALANQFANHLAHTQSRPYHIWQSQDIAQHEPQLASRFAQGYFLPSEGQLDNRQTLLALASALEEGGAQCHWQYTSLPNLSAFDWQIDCRGIGAKSEWNQQKGSQLRGVRGEVLRVYAPEVSLNRPIRLLHPRYPLYVAPKEQHLFVIGATQLESESPAPISVRSSLELLSALYALNPAFGEATLLESMAGLRPTLNHHQPEIRFNAQTRRLAINGLFRHGFMIAPAICQAAAQWLNALDSQSARHKHPHIIYTDLTSQKAT